MIIRDAIPQDLHNLSELFNAYRIFYQQRSDLHRATEFIQQRLFNADSSIFVAVDEQQFLHGFTQLYPIFSSVATSKSFMLNDLYIEPGSRGKGIGKQLMQHAHSFAKSNHAKWIMLQTETQNQQAQSLYESLGYQRDQDCYYYYLDLVKE